MRQYNLTISNNDYNVIIKEVTAEDVLAEVNGVEHRVLIRTIKKLAPKTKSAETPQAVQPIQPVRPSVPKSPPPSPAAVEEGAIVSPIPGHILEVSVSVGDKVLQGQKVLILEAMKLENVITATRDGFIKKILVSEGDAVTHDQQLIIIE